MAIRSFFYCITVSYNFNEGTIRETHWETYQAKSGDTQAKIFEKIFRDVNNKINLNRGQDIGDMIVINYYIAPNKL